MQVIQQNEHQFKKKEGKFIEFVKKLKKKRKEKKKKPNISSFKFFISIDASSLIVHPNHCYNHKQTKNSIRNFQDFHS